MKLNLLASIGVLAVMSSSLFAQKDDVEMKAMRDEMQRSMKALHLESTDVPQPPYFISYKITDTDRMAALASFGSVTSSSKVRSRILTVSVRVGSYEQDNTNFSGGGGGLAGLMAFAGSNVLPVDDNYDELRRKIWIATDTAYKKAVEDLSGKKAARQNQNRNNEAVPDFSKQTARQETETLPAVPEDLSSAEHLVRTASTVFRRVTGVETSSAELEIVNSTQHFIDSEGTTYMRQVPGVSFRANAALQTATGEVLSDSYTAYGRALSDLPAEADMLHEVETVCDRLALRRKAKTAKRYNGPVLVEGQAAAELFAHDFANLLATHRSGSAEVSSLLAVLLGAGGGGGGNANLLEKVGSRVLPDSLTVTNNPTLTKLDGHTLYGDYKFDEEGVPTQETVLVKDGMLKTLLTSRTPARGMLVSTGSQRERGVLPGNLFVEATKTATDDELKAQMMALVKTRGLDYGVIIRRLANNAAIEAIRVYPDGHEDTLRDARVAEITAGTFKDILGVTKERTFFTEHAGGGGDLVTYVVPDMLFEDMTVEHVPNNGPKPPIVPSPLLAQ